jgi:hypothetical protein
MAPGRHPLKSRLRGALSSKRGLCVAIALLGSGCMSGLDFLDCSAKDWILCEGFERFDSLDANLGMKATHPWKVEGGAVSIDSGHARSGRRSLHLRIADPLAAEPTSALSLPLEVALGAEIFIRVYLELRSTLDVSVLRLEGGSGGPPIQNDLALEERRNWTLRQRGSGGNVRLLEATFSAGQTCLEWHFARPAEHDQHIRHEFFVDGASWSSSPLVGADFAPELFKLLLSTKEWSPASHQPIDAWYDDVVVATSRIGCDR